MLKKLQNFSNHVSGEAAKIIEGSLNKCINVGCGEDIRPFWINCDIEPIDQRVSRFDLKRKEDLDWLRVQQADLIECNHVIGYLNLAQAVAFFDAVYDSLVLGGKFIIEFPCIAKIMKLLSQIQSGENYEHDYIETVRGIYAFDMEDAYDVNFDSRTYVFGWTADFVSFQLKRCGFSEIKIMDPRTHCRRVTRDVRVVAIK